jgi:hypothetical protein
VWTRFYFLLFNQAAMADAAEDAAVQSLADTFIASVSDLRATLRAGDLERALASTDLLELTASSLSTRALALVKHVREHCAADIQLEQVKREHVRADLLLGHQKLASELKHVREHAAADIRLAQHRLEQSESERDNMRWDHIRDRKNLQVQTRKEVDGLLAKVDAESTKLMRMEAKAKADAAIARQMLEHGEAQHTATASSLAAELEAQQAEARAALVHQQGESSHVAETLETRLKTMTTRLLRAEANATTCMCTMARETGLLEGHVEQLRKQIATMGEERGTTVAALAQEIDRLRGLIRDVAVPVPPASAMKQIHLESFKRGTNAVVLSSVRSSPSLVPPSMVKETLGGPRTPTALNFQQQRRVLERRAMIPRVASSGHIGANRRVSQH